MFYRFCSWVRRVIKRWGWSRKKAQYWSPNKFAIENIRYYLQYVIWALHWPVANLHFADAASFEDKPLQQRYGYAPRNERLHLSGPPRYDRHSYTTFCMTDLRMRSRGFILSGITEEAHTARHFFHFVLYALGRGTIGLGDILIVDNASIHRARAILRPLTVILALFGARLVFLPTYAPELNPVELIWAQVKNALRGGRRDGFPFLTELVRAFGAVTLENVHNYYRHCLLHFRYVAHALAQCLVAS
jgi:transposase